MVPADDCGGGCGAYTSPARRRNRTALVKSIRGCLDDESVGGGVVADNLALGVGVSLGHSRVHGGVSPVELSRERERHHALHRSAQFSEARYCIGIGSIENRIGRSISFDFTKGVHIRNWIWVREHAMIVVEIEKVAFHLKGEVARVHKSATGVRQLGVDDCRAVDRARLGDDAYCTGADIQKICPGEIGFCKRRKWVWVHGLVSYLERNTGHSAPQPVGRPTHKAPRRGHPRLVAVHNDGFKGGNF